MQTSPRQAGSIVTYVVVGLLLVVASVAAIVAVRYDGSSDTIASRPITEAPQDPDEADKEDSEKSKKEKEAAEAKAAEEKRQAEAAEKEKAEVEAAAQAEKEAEEAAAAAQAEAESQAAVNNDGPMATAGVQAPEELPTTGLAEDLLSMAIGAVAITGAGYLYYHYGTRRRTEDDA